MEFENEKKQGCCKVSLFIYRVVPYSNINKLDYATISVKGVTRMRTDDETEFIPLDRFKYEYEQFHKLRKVSHSFFAYQSITWEFPRSSDENRNFSCWATETNDLHWVLRPQRRWENSFLLFSSIWALNFLGPL